MDNSSKNLRKRRLFLLIDIDRNNNWNQENVIYYDRDGTPLRFVDLEKSQVTGTILQEYFSDSGHTYKEKTRVTIMSDPMLKHWRRYGLSSNCWWYIDRFIVAQLPNDLTIEQLREG